MYKAGELVKKSIIRVDTGNIIGSVADLLVDHDAGRIVGLLTSTGGLFREATIVEWAQVLVWVGDVILVKAGCEVLRANAIPHVHALLEKKIHLTGTPAIGRSGNKLGTIGELLLDETGLIVGYVITRGVLKGERQYVLSSGIAGIGSDAVVVHDEALRDTLEGLEQTIPDPKLTMVMPLTGTRLSVEVPITPANPAESKPSPTDVQRLSSNEIDAILRGDQPIPGATSEH